MKNTNGLVSISLMVFGLLLGVKSVTAANTAGTLDATFGTGGVTVVNIGGIGGVVTSIVVQSNGGILAFIQAGSTSAEVLRFTAGGALDTTFGSNGIAAVPVLIVGTMALEPNGQIVVGGVITPSGGEAELGAVRLNANGTVDTTFGSGGVASISLGNRGPLEGNAMLVEPTGAVLIGAQLDPIGRREPVQTAVARFTLGGVPDTTFGSGGLSITNAVGCTALALLSNGNILVVDGQTVAELTSAGTLESTVTGGVVMASSGSNLNGGPNIFQPNGDYLVAGELFVGEESRGHESSTQVLRFSDTGVADTTFADPSFEFSGPETPDIEAIPNAMAVQSSGAIVVSGQQTKFGTGGNTVNGLARLTSTGDLDSTFGNGGTVTNNVGGSQGIFAVAVQPADQKIVTLGFANNNGALVIARYLGQ